MQVGLHPHVRTEPFSRGVTPIYLWGNWGFWGHWQVPVALRNQSPIVEPVCFPKCVPRCPGIFLFSQSREASQSPHRDSLEPRVPVFRPNTLHIRKKDTRQWWGAVLGTVARWLLLDSIHDHCGLSGVLHPTDNYQVRGQGAEPHTFMLVIGPKSLWEFVGMQNSI